MTLIHSSPATAAPRLHALIIGVAKYPHLLNGDPSERARQTYGMGQVRSPRHSAVELARWLIDNYDNPNGVELGSVELLASPDVQWQMEEGSLVTVDEPRFDAILKAAKEWFDRCNSDRDNIALFYFCGHGLMDRGLQFLLPQDFGDPRNLRGLWANGIEFDGFHANMTGCDAQTQMFFVDACSNSPEALKQDPAVGHPLIESQGAGRLPETVVVVHAAAPGKKVDLPDPQHTDLTCFTEALLKCLNGCAAENPEGNLRSWVIHTDSLRGILPQMTCHVGDRYDTPQSPRPGGWGRMVDLHQLDTPLVFTKISCAERERPKLRVDLVQTLNEDPSVRDASLPWYGDLPVGKWNIKVRFEDIRSENVTKTTELEVRPPYRRTVVSYDDHTG